MRASFIHNTVNGPFEDPGVYVRMFDEKRALLFDAGEISRLSKSALLKVSDIFITHTHIDHFIGFDTLLRACLIKPEPIRVFGPSNIIDCVEGKLKGYTWNLIDNYPISIDVHAIDGTRIRHANFSSKNGLRLLDTGETEFNGIILDEDSLKVSAVVLNHGIDCIGYALEEDFHINIIKTRLDEMGLPVGPWLNEFKKIIRLGLPDDTEVRISEKEFRLDELKNEITTITKGQKISYVTDVGPTRENIEAVRRLVKDSDTIYCEAYFLHEDIERARERNHLTAKIAGWIARDARAGKFVPIHFSPKYMNADVLPESEAMAEYLNGSEGCPA